MTLPTINAVVFVSIAKKFCLCEFSVFNICKNVLISNISNISFKILAVKSATLFFYTDLQDKFEKFVENLKINLESLCQNHPFLIALSGYLNVKTKKWYCNDKSSYEGSVIENVTALYDLIIKEPSHISITSSFCSDLQRKIWREDSEYVNQDSKKHPLLFHKSRFLTYFKEKAQLPILSLFFFLIIVICIKFSNHNLCYNECFL